MRQLLQQLDSGVTLLAETPVPAAGSGRTLVETRATVISAGTERMLVEFGRAGLLAKARSQPDKVRQVLDKVRTDGLAPTLEAVRAKLAAPIPLGYCQAGVVVEVGPGVSAFRVGDRVVTNGAHAEYVRVPVRLTARIPEGVDFEVAAFTPLAAIGLQGIRLAAPTLGETIVVYGLGLIGLLTVQLLRAAGCRVLGIDRDAARLQLAETSGATVIDGAAGDIVQKVQALTGGVGADAVLLTLASDSDEPVLRAAEMSRKRGRIVLIGVTGLHLSRDAFYQKELSFAVSCSYGPGRYDPGYEEQGHDYPLPFVRWTEQRNFDAVLELMRTGALDPRALISHRFAFQEAPRAYDLIASGEPSLGVVLTYDDRNGAPIRPEARILASVRPLPHLASPCSAGVIGAGNFSVRTLIPSLKKAGARLHTIASSGGVDASVAGTRLGFEVTTTALDAIFEQEAINTVFVVTRHDSHASLALRALAAGKNVFVEKPLALREEDLDRLEQAVISSGRMLTVGFNRRFAPMTVELRRLLAGRAGPVAIVATMNAGRIPSNHWTQDPEIGGGRIVGEACHMLDLIRNLAGSSIVDVHALAARDRSGNPIGDIAHLSVSLADGSTGVVHYFANGGASFPKERIECFFDGRTLVIDNWRRIKRYGLPSPWFEARRRIDKGHDAELAAWVGAIGQGGPPPIPLDEVLEVSRWAIRAGGQVRTQS